MLEKRVQIKGMLPLQIQQRAWRKLAEKEGLPFPELERGLFGLRPERAIMDVSFAELLGDSKFTNPLGFESS